MGFSRLQDEGYPFTYYFDKQELLEGTLSSDVIPETWYLVIEKPNAEYIQVSLNRRVIGSNRDPGGRSNLLMYFRRVMK